MPEVPAALESSVPGQNSAQRLRIGMSIITPAPSTSDQTTMVTASDISSSCRASARGKTHRASGTPIGSWTMRSA